MAVMNVPGTSVADSSDWIGWVGSSGVEAEAVARGIFTRKEVLLIGTYSTPTPTTTLNWARTSVKEVMLEKTRRTMWAMPFEAMQVDGVRL